MGGLGKNRSGERAKSRKGYDRKGHRARQKNMRGAIQKWDQTDSPEIPDRGEISEISQPPFGDVESELLTDITGTTKHGSHRERHYLSWFRAGEF